MRRRFVGWWVLAVVALAGCPGSGTDKFVPSEGAARQALETALDAWKGGQAKPGKLTMGGVAVNVVDATWESGQKLTAYQIVSEEPGDGRRWVNVKHDLAKG